MRYDWKITGTASDGQTWTTRGIVQQAQSGNFPDLVTQIQRDSFQQLTRGRAVYGKPGVGCNGPYTISGLAIELVEP